MKTTIVTEPTGNVISLDEAVKHLNGVPTEDYGYVQSAIFSAVAAVENITNRKLLTQTWTAYADRWPAAGFQLPYGNLQSVASVKYLDTDGTEHTVDSADYIVDIVSDPGWVRLAYGASWPTESLYPSNPIRIEFTCGYGVHTATAVTGASSASPIVMTQVGHSFLTGSKVRISDVGGNTNANGTWRITKLTDDTYSLDGSEYNAAYTSGGVSVPLEVPEPIRAAILLMVGDSYSNRETVVIGQDVNVIPGYVIGLVGSYRLGWFS